MTAVQELRSDRATAIMEYVNAMINMYANGSGKQFQYGLSLWSAFKTFGSFYDNYVPAEITEIRGERGQIKQCYKNSQAALVAHPTLKYCEGLMLSEGLIPIEHAWNLLPDGRVIDITRDALESINKSDRREATYFGVEIPREFVLKQIVKTECYTDQLWRYLDLKASRIEVSETS